MTGQHLRVVIQEAPAAEIAEGFLELPNLVYRDDPVSIPEDPRATLALFSQANPWFRTGRAATFSVPGKARAAAFRATDLVIEGVPSAFFGYFESMGDHEAERELFQEVEAWAAAQGAHRLYGPINFTTFLSYRVLLATEPGAAQFPFEPWNPLTYDTHLRALGYAMHTRYLTQVVSGEEMRRAREAHRPILDKLVAEGFRFLPLTAELLAARMPEMHRLCDAIFGANFAYTPLSFEVFRAHAEELAARMCSRTSTLCLAPDGAIAGVFLVFPDWGPLVRRGAETARPRLSEIRTETHFDRLRAAEPLGLVLKTVGVAPKYRRHGVFAGLLVSLLDRADGLYERYLGALIREDNPSRRFFDPYAPTKRWYALYAKDIPNTSPRSVLGSDGQANGPQEPSGHRQARGPQETSAHRQAGLPEETWVPTVDPGAHTPLGSTLLSLATQTVSLTAPCLVPFAPNAVSAPFGRTEWGLP